MSYNGSGTFQINTSGQPVVAGTVISSTAFNALTADLATGLSTAITKDGQTATTVRIPFAAGISSTLTTDSSSVSTGSIITAGGAGIAKALYVGTNANVAGTLAVTGVATFSAAPIYSSLTASSAVATDASKALVSVTNTGTGNNVLATSPTLVTPVLGAASATSITVDAGAVGTPSITTTSDTNTGIFFPAADTIAFAEGGAEAMRIDSSGLVGIGTTTPSSFGGGLVVRKSNTAQGVTNATAQFSDAVNSALWVGHTSGATNLVADAALTFGYTNGTTTTERMRIHSGGEITIGTTSLSNPPSQGISLFGHVSNSQLAVGHATGTGSGQYYTVFGYAGTTIGGITQNGTTAVAYNTSSDYRLKNTIAPMTGALAKVQALKPVTYKWNADGSDGQGFIAHELQAVIPDCVTGEKDGIEIYIDEDGNEQTKPQYQGIDTSFLVATLTAAIQEQQALITALTARITALEAK